MAQIVRQTGRKAPKFASPPGYEVVSDTGKATENIGRGQGCVRGASGWSIAPTTAKEIDGVALKDYANGQDNCEFLIQGEMSGFELSGGGDMTPGPLYPSQTVAGQFQTDVVAWYAAATTPAVSVPVQPSMKIVGPNTIRVNLV